MRTSTNLPLRGFTRRTRVPKGRLGWAAVRASVEKTSPLAVLRPLKPGPYQLALPVQLLIGLIGALRCATSGASITGAMRNMRSTHRIAAQIMKSRCLIVCTLCYETPKKCSTKASLCQPFCGRGLLCNALTLNTLASESALGRASTNLSLALGSAKLAVPTCTADAPTERYSSTSSAVSTPPRPIIGDLTVFFVSQTSLKVMGLIAGPESPPVEDPSLEIPVRKSRAIAG